MELSKQRGLRVTDTHVYFWGSVFSNFYKCSFELLGQKFSSSEQAFMWCKAKAFKDEEIAGEILKTSDPKKAKSLGRKVKNYDDAKWDMVRYDLMVKVNKAKFSQNKGLLTILKDTGSRKLVEASPLDKIWGVGLHYEDDTILDESNWVGKNLLGEALMEVRDLLL